MVFRKCSEMQMHLIRYKKLECGSGTLILNMFLGADNMQNNYGFSATPTLSEFDSTAPLPPSMPDLSADSIQVVLYR